MKTKYTMALTLLAGVAIGAIAVQGLHAQGAKLKAYAIAERSRCSDRRVSAAQDCSPHRVGQRGRRIGVLQVGRMEGVAAPAG